MVKAFVMINVKVGTDVDVARELRSVPNVLAVYDVYGTYDLIAELEAPTLAELYATLSTGVRSLENIVSTHTLMSVR